MLLALLTLLAAVVFAGCGSAPQDSGEGQPSQAAGSSEGPSAGETAEGSGGRSSKERLGHPALGSARAPVVLTEYADYQ
ncbi:MAG: hypothetical protein M3P70_06585 [Actinomycetota bacterium]|nr:hypothetical protein [Actinomycetota bacterium]